MSHLRSILCLSLVLLVGRIQTISGFNADVVLGACPSTTPPTSPFLKDPSQVKDLKKLIVEAENGEGGEGSVGGDVNQIWRLRATAPKFLPPVPPPAFITENSPFDDLEVYQVVKDGETRVDNVIFSRKKMKKVTLIHKAKGSGEIGGGGTKRTYLTLQSVVLSDMNFEDEGRKEASNIWRITQEPDEEEGGEMVIGDVRVEDFFGFNVPMPPLPINIFADSTAYETTFENDTLRITRGGNGFNAFGDFRVFERVKMDLGEGEGEGENQTMEVLK